MQFSNYRRRNCNDDESNMGGQSADVHNASWLTDCISKFMGSRLTDLSPSFVLLTHTYTDGLSSMA